MVEARQIVVTEGEEKIIYKKLDETEKETSKVNYEIFDDFMLKKPEPLKKDIKFTVHKLGVKGTMRRTEIYEDR